MPDITYEVLTVDSVPDYIAGRPALAGRLAHIDSVREVGDGNLNLVFVVTGKDAYGNPAGLVLKQALPYVRADPSWPMTPARNHAEARALRVHGQFSPGLVPAFYDTDPQRYILAIEDLSDHQVWRGALNEGQRHDHAAAALGTYVADLAFNTSAFGVDAEQLKARVAEALNPALCKITELLVFTEPYAPAGRTTIDPRSAADVAAYGDDPDVVAAIGVAKWNFMTRAEALIHGDLHTGSVMVRAESATGEASTKAFDSEFAFYGPVGFDLGLLWANLVLAAARSAALGDAANLTWRLAQPAAAWHAFEARLRAHWPRRVDSGVFTDRMLEAFLDRVWRDALDATAAEAARRVIGPYPVSDIQTLDPDKRVRAVRATLAACRYVLLDEDARNNRGVAAVFDRVGDIVS